mgnify:CR=1 FL=1
MAAPTITFAVAAGKIDAEAGVIRGVSLISEGPALGHGVMVDALLGQHQTVIKPLGRLFNRLRCISGLLAFDDEHGCIRP